MASKPAVDEKPEDDTPKKKKSLMLPLGFVLCFLLSVGASSGVTFFLMQPSANASPLEITVTEQGELLTGLETSMAQQNKKIQAIEEQNDILKLYLRHSSATALKNILINQEQNIQAYLKVMKSSMEDLSSLVPRTTDWNNEYQYQLDLALKGSIQREDLLAILKTGEPNDTASQ
ncbi:hypothetical protein J9B83_04760 [Marinomonas sp. A79]|uniref:Uncharacterized protein n=1 Tax=Marinomonas vulgaris TaxID=2823372 RepID=A0ABS5H9X8_9GAMM|nr:hypothetical protein [Marinomonas vulgaris]MBR7888247.1 hypothetical protein [Marinomonas vulgaris]